MLIACLTILFLSLIYLFDKAALVLWSSVFLFVLESVEVILLLVMLC